MAKMHIMYYVLCILMMGNLVLFIHSIFLKKLNILTDGSVFSLVITTLDTLDI